MTTVAFLLGAALSALASAVLHQQRIKTRDRKIHARDNMIDLLIEQNTHTTRELGKYLVRDDAARRDGKIRVNREDLLRANTNVGVEDDDWYDDVGFLNAEAYALHMEAEVAREVIRGGSEDSASRTTEDRTEQTTAFERYVAPTPIPAYEPPAESTDTTSQGSYNTNRY